MKNNCDPVLRQDPFYDRIRSKKRRKDHLWDIYLDGGDLDATAYRYICIYLYWNIRKSQWYVITYVYYLCDWCPVRLWSKDRFWKFKFDYCYLNSTWASITRFPYKPLNTRNLHWHAAPQTYNQWLLSKINWIKLFVLPSLPGHFSPKAYNSFNNSVIILPRHGKQVWSLSWPVVNRRMAPRGLTNIQEKPDFSDCSWWMLCCSFRWGGLFSVTHLIDFWPTDWLSWFWSRSAFSPEQHSSGAQICQTIRDQLWEYILREFVDGSGEMGLGCTAFPHNR